MTESVKCKSGYHVGIKSDDIFIFQGITYGKFDQRWGKSYLTTDYQKEFSKSISSAPQTVIEKSILYDSSIPEEKEQCLSLNIASPNLDDKLPVLVWIHGGGFMTGSSHSTMYQIQNLAMNGMVVVSINYRLGPFGFLRLKDITEGEIDSSGNEGLRDQRVALQWIQKNIEHFGGNKDNVTICGLSSGSWSCALQIAAGHGNLFRNAICQSGGLDAIASLDKANKWGELFLQRFLDLGLSIDDLMHCPWEKIIEAAKKLRHYQLSEGGKLVLPEIGYLPVIDNDFLKDDFAQVFDQSEVNIIAGSTLDEYNLWSFFHPKIRQNDEKYILKRLKKIFINDFLDEILEVYEEFLDSKNLAKIFSAVMTDISFGIPTHNLLTKSKGKNFGYLFSTQSKLMSGKLGCFHASELPYMFGVHKTQPYDDWCSENGDSVSHNIQSSWKNFVDSSNPSFDDFTWQEYNDGQLTLLGSRVKTITNPFLERYKLVEKYKNF